MKLERFKTQREFNNRFPSKFFICSNCNMMTPNKYTCSHCGWRADGLFKTMGNGYQFIIEEQGEVIQEIFTPIEIRIQKNAADNN